MVIIFFHIVFVIIFISSFFLKLVIGKGVFFLNKKGEEEGTRPPDGYDDGNCSTTCVVCVTVCGSRLVLSAL